MESISAHSGPLVKSRDADSYDFGPGFWLMCALALLVQFIAIDPIVNLYDEGIILVGADSILRGGLPYKDFWSMYGPGSFYLTSMLFWLFEPSGILVRLIGMVSKSLIVALVYVITSRFASRTLAKIGAALVLCVLIGLRQDAFPVFPAVAFALGALMCLEKGLGGDVGKFFAAGLLTGLIACFRHDLGLYMAVAAGAALFAVPLVFPNPACPYEFRRSLKALVHYAVGVLLVSGGPALYLLCKVPLADLYENLIYIPSSIYPATRHLPWPMLEEAMAIARKPGTIASFSVYAPFLICLPVVMWTALRVARSPGANSSHEEDPKARSAGIFLLLASLVCLIFTLKGFVRVSPIHMAQSLVLAVPIALVAVSRSNRRKLSGKIAFAFAQLPALVLIVALGIAGLIAIRKGAVELVSSRPGGVWAHCLSPGLPTLRCLDIDPDYLEAASFVKNNSGPDDFIYVGLNQHDRIYISAVAFYFFAERKPVTKWYELHPGVQTQARVQTEMIGEMQAHPPKLLVLDERWQNVKEPNLSGTSSGVELLDRYIHDQYVEVARFGTVQILAPKPNARLAAPS